MHVHLLRAQRQRGTQLRSEYDVDDGRPQQHDEQYLVHDTQSLLRKPLQRMRVARQLARASISMEHMVAIHQQLLAHLWLRVFRSLTRPQQELRRL